MPQPRMVRSRTSLDPRVCRQGPDQAPRQRVPEHVDDQPGPGAPPVDCRRRGCPRDVDAWSSVGGEAFETSDRWYVGGAGDRGRSRCRGHHQRGRDDGGGGRGEGHGCGSKCPGASDRPLDEQVRGGRDGEGDPAAQQPQRGAGEARAVPVDGEEHRPVPQVDAVGDQPEGRQGRDGQRAGAEPVRCDRDVGERRPRRPRRRAARGGTATSRCRTRVSRPSPGTPRRRAGAVPAGRTAPPPRPTRCARAVTGLRCPRSSPRRAAPSASSRRRRARRTSRRAAGGVARRE